MYVYLNYSLVYAHRSPQSEGMKSSKADWIQARRLRAAADEHELDLFLNAPQRQLNSPDARDSSAAFTAVNGPADASEFNDQVPPRGRTETGALLPGLVILKGFLTPEEQQELVNESRKMGLQEGGFYKPTYASGAKCRLHQMCLGRHWNVKTEKYEDRRSNFDDAPVPALPESWKVYAQRSLNAASEIDPQVMGTCKKMTPDICVVNFYKKAGRNGMHIDKDESDEAMSMGSPVISFSIGSAAEFAYIDHYPDPHEAVPIVRLESGDVLVFGGPARNVVHALTRVYNGMQPSWLHMRSGRLNLTFREYKPSELES
jgi:alkylated DNA repair protein (DNA oxidative demethylase)